MRHQDELAILNLTTRIEPEENTSEEEGPEKANYNTVKKMPETKTSRIQTPEEKLESWCKHD